MKIIRVRLEDEHYTQLEAVATSLSLDVSTFLKVAASREAERVSSGRRTRSPGRPAGGGETGRITELNRLISNVYNGLRTGSWLGHEAAFTKTFGEQIARFDNLLSARDLEGLEAFWEERPWVLEQM